MPLTEDIETARVQADVEHALRSLGATYRDVATTLERLGVTGEPAVPTHCPVANYLYDANTGAESISVGDDTVICPTEAQSRSNDWYTQDFTVPVPEPVRAFIVRFDADPSEFPLLARSAR